MTLGWFGVRWPDIQIVADQVPSLAHMLLISWRLAQQARTVPRAWKGLLLYVFMGFFGGEGGIRTFGSFLYFNSLQRHRVLIASTGIQQQARVRSSRSVVAEASKGNP